MKLVKIYLLISCSLFALMVSAQCLAPFQDINNFVYVFDAGESHYLENLPLQSFKVGRNNIMAYVGQNNRLKVYYKGQVIAINDNSPNYYMTDNWFLYQNYNVLKVLFHDDFLTLENQFTPGEDSLYYSDSLIVWTNARGELNVFYRGITQILERTAIHRAKIGPNIFAYVDVNNNFKVFYQGQLQTIETYEPRNYVVNQDMLMYIDQYNNYKFFADGQMSETEIPNVWNEYHVGRDFATYISNLKQLVVRYNGEDNVLLEDRPAKYSVRENMLVYADKGNNFWCWYKGKTYWLERYIPQSWKMDNDIVVYQDLDGRLKGFYYGEQLQISDQIVKEYNLYNEAVTYSLQPYETKVWCNKKTYTFN